MKNVIKTLICLAYCFALLCMDASGVTVDTSAPYSGEYVFLYNTGSSAETIASIPSIEASQAAEEYVSEIPANAVAVEETESGTLYRVEAVFEEDSDYSPVMMFTLDDDYRAFTASDLYKESTYSFYANKVHEDEICKIYIEENQISKDDETALAEDMAAEFAKVISHVNTNFADYSGQTTLLIHDIRDPYYYNVSNVYTGGYFYSAEYNAGERILHLDLFPLMAANKQSVLNPADAYSTMAHEFTHLVEYSVNGANRLVDKIWFSELFALSSEAAMYPDESDNQRFQHFWQDYSNIIKNGAVLNYGDYTVNGNDLSSNYGLLYIFGRYLKTQYGDDVFKGVLNASIDAESAEAALLEGIKEKGTEITFDELIKNFYIAIVTDESEGIFKLLDSNYSGYINMPFNLSGSVSLKPGAAVVVPIFNEEFNPDGLSEDVLYTVFSSESESKITSLETEYEKVSVVPGYMTAPYNLSANGATLYGSEFAKKVIFIGDKNAVLFGRDGSFYSKKNGTVTVRCQSVANKELYTEFEVDSNSDPVHLNYHSKPYYDSKNGGIVLTVLFLDTQFAEGKTYDILIAAYDKSGTLIACTKRTQEFTNAGVPYQRGLQSEDLKEDGEYTIKLFVFDSEGNLLPQTDSFVIDYKKE